MKRIALLALIAFPLLAQAGDKMLETTEEARARHEADRYEQYRKQGNQEPLGGYSDKLGDPAPYGTSSPGRSSTWEPAGRNEDWRSRAKR